MRIKIQEKQYLNIIALYSNTKNTKHMKRDRARGNTWRSKEREQSIVTSGNVNSVSLKKTRNS